MPRDLSQQELERLAEYFSILREWSLEIQRNDLQEHDDAPVPKATTSLNLTKSGVKKSSSDKVD